MGTVKMIVIWGSKNILHNSIAHILASNPDWRVVSVSNRDELEHTLRQAEEIKCEVVIILEGCHGDPKTLPFVLLDKPWTNKVIAVSLEDNLIDVYSKQIVYYHQVSDLINLIDNQSGIA